MQGKKKQRCLFVAIDRATRWVSVATKPNKLLTCNGKEFED